MACAVKKGEGITCFRCMLPFSHKGVDPINVWGSLPCEMRDFSFVFETYNLYFSIFQYNYVVLLEHLHQEILSYNILSSKKAILLII